jgi:hypothetical protein
LQRIAELRENFACDPPTIFAIDGHSTHVTPRVVAPCGAWKIIFIKFIPHSAHLAKPLDLCAFVLFKMIHQKEKDIKRTKGETRTIYRALLAFYKSIIISKICWSFERA